MHWKGGAPPPPPPPGLQGPQPMPSHCPRRFVTDSNRPQPLWQPPPTACLTASGAASEAPSRLMHPWGGVGVGGWVMAGWVGHLRPLWPPNPPPPAVTQQ